MPQELRSIALHRLIRKEDRPYAALLTEYDRGLRMARDYLEGGITANSARVMVGGERLDKKVLRALQKVIANFTKLVAYAKAIELRRHEIVLATIAGAASNTVQRNCRFSQVRPKTLCAQQKYV